MAREPYVLIIKNETTESKTDKLGGAGGVANVAGESTGGAKKSSASATAGKIVNSVFGYQAVKSAVNQVVAFNVSMVQTRTGSVAQQQKASFVYSRAQTAVGILEATAMGAITGGPVGAIGAFAISALSAVVNFGMSYTLESQRLREESNLETISRDMSAQRATYSGSRYQNATMG